MSIWAITICTVLYLYVSVDNFFKRDYPHSLMWLAYGIANIGLLWHQINTDAKL